MRRVTMFAGGALVVLSALVPGYAADDCTATLNVELVRQENSYLEFKIAVTTDASKARVEYLFLITKTTRTGESKTVTVPRVVMINDTTSNEFVTHTLESGETFSSSDTRLVSCKPNS